MTWQTISTSAEETERLGKLLGKLLKPPAVIELRSDLGGGKTTFVRGLARGMGSKDVVTSPTFTLNQIYKGRNGVALSHHDFYRLKEAGIMVDELSESLHDNMTVTVVEWADVVEDVLPKDRVIIMLRPVASNSEKREIEITYPGIKIGIIEKAKTQWAKLRP
ncbi:MAG TPA: tRNA (adenosine(37)-N6)-threonylcarbamoyltransferase complex ATPase subunit type 1 TsaE [Candidatus Saccharimonadales bacterium]|nr:tRNA (adenosine(37)-N6)-threonylcarbamoyltransferase complex ATPase subunit type 1 TsaE [Candidatus Saccharimonadales bacterium]